MCPHSIIRNLLQRRPKAYFSVRRNNWSSSSVLPWNAPRWQHYFLPNGSDHTFNPTNQIQKYQQFITTILGKKKKKILSAISVWKNKIWMSLNNIFCTEFKNLLKLEKYLGIQPYLHLKLQIAEKSITPACKVLQYCWKKKPSRIPSIWYFNLFGFHNQLLELINHHQQLNLHKK